MDEIAKYNQARWRFLVEANALFTRPKFNLDKVSARKMVDPDGKLGDVFGKNVLCLAGGGGQQSAAFALLGANGTVFDLSKEQLKRDIEIAEHYKTEIKVVQGDMRNLSCFEKESFDIVFHAYSLNFVPDAKEVFRQVAGVLQNGGIYRFNCANPFTMGTSNQDWNGNGYTLKEPYLNKAQITYKDQNWVYERDEQVSVPNPVEYRHTLSELINGLINSGFVLHHFSDSGDMYPDLEDDPGSWDHFVAFAPPWFSFWASFRPDFKVE
jgi:ubiquinone/menaquinone biosynthesis C-methylase UbiE